MSSIGYQGLLCRVSQRLEDVTKINQLLHTSSNARLISENSESFNIKVGEGDNTAITLMKLFSDLAESDNLGLDNLETLRDLLTEVKEWSLVDEVDKFARQRKAFNALLETIIPKLEELDNVEQLLSLCEDHISDDAKEEIKDLSALLKELQKKNRLGFTRLAVLRKILNETGQQELLDLLTDFEKKWKEEEKAERRRGMILPYCTNTSTFYCYYSSSYDLLTHTLNVLHSKCSSSFLQPLQLIQDSDSVGFAQ